MLQSSPLFAYIPAKDLDRARRFYEGKLGFRPTLENNGGVPYGCAGGTDQDRESDKGASHGMSPCDVCGLR